MASVARFVLGGQAVLTSQIFEDGQRLRQFYISVDVVRQLDTIYSNDLSILHNFN